MQLSYSVFVSEGTTVDVQQPKGFKNILLFPFSSSIVVTSVRGQRG